MRITITALNGNSPANEIKNILQRVKNRLDHKSGNVIADTLKWTTRNHVMTIYPGSTHHNPNKIDINNATGNSGSIDVDIPGITRAYHDLDIRPKTAQRLTIPIHRDAYGMRARGENLFYVKKKNGKEFLAKRLMDGSIAFMYFLSKGVHQRQDSRLMPSDETYYENMIQRLNAMLMNSSNL